MQKGWARFVRAQPFAASSVTMHWAFWREARENFYQMCACNHVLSRATLPWQVGRTLEGFAKSRTGGGRAPPEVPVGFVRTRQSGRASIPDTRSTRVNRDGLVFFARPAPPGLRMTRQRRVSCEQY